MIGSLGSGGSGVREVDDTIRELRKENFNLKLRIYFLEERLGSSSKLNIQAGSKDELIQVYQVVFLYGSFLKRRRNSLIFFHLI